MFSMGQVTLDGRRNQIFLTLSTAAEFRDNLNLFSEFYSQLGKYPSPSGWVGGLRRDS